MRILLICLFLASCASYEDTDWLGHLDTHRYPPQMFDTSPFSDTRDGECPFGISGSWVAGGVDPDCR